MSEFLDAVSIVGFPVVVAAYVLIRLNGKIERLTTAIQSLERVLNQHLSRDDVKAIIESYLKLDKPNPAGRGWEE